MSIFMDTGVCVYFSVIAFLFGAVMGSFLNCAAWRIAHKENFLKGRSRCPQCGHVLGVADLFPLFSYLFLRGKCRYCQAKIPVRYFLTELFFALLTLGCLWRFDLTPLCLRNYVFFCVLFVLSLVDLEIFEIPDGCHIIAAIAWLAYLPFAPAPLETLKNGLLAALVFGGGLLVLSLLMDKLLKKESLGGGDIKLYAVVGLCLGIVGTLFSLIFACLFGLVFAFVKRLVSGDSEKMIPFGPSIAAAACLMLFFGERLVNWYLSLL